MKPLEPGSQLGRYTLTQEVGHGGMGRVYRAVDETLGHTVAVKVLHARNATDPEMIERFRREARVMARIQHPGIPRVYCLDAEDGRHFYAMDYIESDRLDRVLEASYRVTPPRALPILIQIADALQALHEAGYTHRDVKPKNALVDSRGRAYLTDFGFCRPIAGGKDDEALHDASDERVAGTAAYLAPECWQRKEYDHRADIYAFGAMMYQLLTGDLPFGRENTTELRRRHVQADRVTPPASEAVIPAGARRVIDRCLAVDPDRRYQSAEALRADLAGCLAEIEHPTIPETAAFAVPQHAVSPSPDLFRIFGILAALLILIFFLAFLPLAALRSLRAVTVNKQLRSSRIELLATPMEGMVGRTVRVVGMVESVQHVGGGQWAALRIRDKTRIGVWSPGPNTEKTRVGDRVDISGPLQYDAEASPQYYLIATAKKEK